MKKKFTLLIALALIVSAANAQHRQLVRHQGEPLRLEQGIISDGVTMQKATSAENQGTPPMQTPIPGTVVLSQGFEGTTGVAIPAGWTMNNSTTGTITATTNGAWMTTGTNVHSGTRAALINLNASGTTANWGELYSPDFSLTAGTTYQISLWVYWGPATSGTTMVDNLTVYLLKGPGDSTDPIIETVMDNGPFTGQDAMPQQMWTRFFINFTPPETGDDYYLYFFGANVNTLIATPSPSYRGGNLRVDDVNVQELTLYQNDLSITAPAYPFSQVPATQNVLPTFSADVLNMGTDVQTNVVLTVKHNGTVIGTSAPLASLAPWETATLTVNTTADPVVVGDNTITYTVSQDQTDDDPSDNSYTTTFTGTPHLFATDDGSITTYLNSTANYRYGTVYTFTQPTTINQVQGYFYSGHATTTNGYTLRIQEATDPNNVSATVLYSQTFTVASGNAWANVTLTTPQTLPAGSYFISFSVNATTLYLLADAGIQGRTPYASTTNTGTALSYGTGSAFLRLMVDLPENDIQIVPTTTGFPYAQIPLVVGQDLPFPTLTANVLNAGTTTQNNIVFSATYNGTDIGSSSPLASLAPLGTSAMTLTPTAGTVFPTTLGTSDLVYTVAQDETDANPADNSLTSHFKMTKDVYAIDNVGTDNIVGAGYTTSGSKIGNIFTIPATVTLKQVQIGFDNAATAVAQNLVLNRVTSTTQINATNLFSSTVSFTRPAGGGWITVDVPPTDLTAGQYFLAVQSTTTANHLVGCDPMLNNTIYLASSSTTTTIAGQAGTFGAGAIRMVLDVCMAPTALTVSDITTDAATIAWTPGNTETEWTLEYATDAAFTENEATIDNITPDPTYTFTGLDDNTTYYVRVKSVCGANESDWSDAVNFTTQIPFDQCGDGVVVGTGTTTQVNVPVWSYDTYSYTQTIYLGSEITAAGGTANDITSIAYHWNGTSNLNNSTSWTIYIGQTDKTSFSSTSDWVPVGSMQQVFSGTVSLPTAAGWMNIPLDNAFAWDGTSNIVVAVHENQSGYASSPGAAWFSTSGSNRTLYYGSDSADPNPVSPSAGTRGSNYPNIKLNICPPPTCPKPVNIIVSNLTMTSADISWTEAGTATAWTVEYSLTDDFTTIEGTVNITSIPVTLTGLTANTQYYVRVKAVCTAGTDESAWTTSSFYTGYCIPPTPSTTTYYLSSVTTTGGVVDNVNYTNSTANSAGYHLTDQVVSAIPDDDITLSLTIGGGSYNSGYFYCWVDMNNDMIFDNATEEVVATTSYAETYSGTITIPNLPEGDYRVRVATSYSGAIPSACSNSSYGDFVDFTLHILPPPTCPRPTDLMVDNITMTTADVSWTETGTATAWTVEYSTDPNFVSVEGTVNATSIPATLTDLTSGTTYYVKVKAVCTAGTDESNWTQVVSFATEPDPCLNGVQVGTGTTTQYYVPIYNLYGYTYSQAIYLASEITDAGGTANTITRIGFQWNGTGNLTNGDNWTIYIGQTDKTSFSSNSDWVPVGSMQQVFSGHVALPITAGWMNIELDTPFAWDGTSNIVVAVHETVPNYGSTAYWVSTTGSNRTIYYYSDTTNPDPASPPITGSGLGRGTSYPNIRLGLCHIPDVDAAITAITAPVSGVNLSATEHVTATLKNLGANPLTSAQMKLTVDGTPIATETYTGNLATGNTTNFTFAATADMSAAGDHTVTVEAIATGDAVADNNSMTVTVTNQICTAMELPYFENFDASLALPPCWSTIDADGDGYTWFIMASQHQAGLPEYDAYSLENFATSQSWSNYVALHPDNYLITPPLLIPANGAKLEYMIGESYNDDGDNEHYEVLVSTTGTNISDFTDVLLEETLTTTSWEPRTNISLAAYAGQTIYIAFRHFNCYDVELLKLDDVSIMPLTGVSDNPSRNIAVYPNPVTTTFVIKNAAGSQAKIYDVSGKLVYNAPVANDNQTVDISNVSSGVYFLELQSSTSKSTVKLIKK